MAANFAERRSEPGILGSLSQARTIGERCQNGRGHIQCPSPRLSGVAGVVRFVRRQYSRLSALFSSDSDSLGAAPRRRSHSKTHFGVTGRACVNSGGSQRTAAVLSAAISWSVPRQYRSNNPCQHVRRLKTGEGWAAWSWEAISTFRDDAVPEMWLAGALALYTGQRQADVLQMSWNDIDAGTIVVVQQKSGAKKKTVWIPIHRDLRTVLDAAPRRSTRILTNRNGHPWTSDGFRSVWADQMVCLELRSGILHGLVLHGLRKSAVCFLIEAGCTTAEVSAISGQSLQMVEHYATMMNRKKLAASAILKWESENSAG